MAITIPFLDVGDGGALATLRAERARALELLAIARRSYTGVGLRLGDALSRRWLRRSGNLYAEQIRAVAVELARPGATLLNLSYEWACTASVAADPCGGGMRLRRTLDWPLPGLGRNVIVARESSPAGPFLNVTWPGAVGVLTAMAPGRFAVAINQAPLRGHGVGFAGDWLLERVGVWRRAALPPAHLVRAVLERAPDYATARRMLAEQPIALPCFFSLSGVTPLEGCVIERWENSACIHAAPIACANDWLSPGQRGRARGTDNTARRQHLAASEAAQDDGFEWVVPPVLNPMTRLAVVANAARGFLAVRGIEGNGVVTRDFVMNSNELRAG
jgi:hypothetical protein